LRELANIRQLYKPIQPTVKQSARHVSYVEFLPDLRLQNYIYCYWQLQTSQALNEPFHYRVVADGCIDIFFELTDPADSYVMGFCKRYTEFPLENEFNYVGIRFLPTMFPQLFRVNAGEREAEISFLLPEHPSQQPLFHKPFTGQGMFLTIEVDNVDKLYKDLKKKGAEIKIELRDEPWGDRHFAIVDPNGIGIDLVTYAPAEQK